MILVTVGSQKFQFNRLLKEIDKLLEQNKIHEKVFAQIGVSDYKPQHYECIDFMSQEAFLNKINQASIIITHAGTGTIINAIKLGKKVIAIPRLKKYGEHVDDHQIQLIKEFADLNLIEPVYEINNLYEAIEIASKKEYSKYSSNTKKVLYSIEEFIGD